MPLEKEIQFGESFVGNRRNLPTGEAGHRRRPIRCGLSIRAALCSQGWYKQAAGCNFVKVG